MSTNLGHLDVTTPYFCSYCAAIHEWAKCPLQDTCRFCKTRPATLHFGDMLSFTHGGDESCCTLCAAEMQLTHAQERAALIPELEKKVAQLRAETDAGEMR